MRVNHSTNSGPSLPIRLLSLFQRGDYSKRGRNQIDLICESVSNDLLTESPVLADAAERGELVAERSYSPPGHRFYQDVDFVVGTPNGSSQQALSSPQTFPTQKVDDVWFALNVESLVSSVSKNWKNRGKDIHSFYLGVYDIAPLAATGCILVLNLADLDRDPDEIIDSYREFDFASGSLAQNLDALAIVPIWYEPNAPEETELVSDLISIDDELHYSSFVHTMAEAIEQRFKGEYQVSPDSIESVLARQESDILEFKTALPSHLDTLRKEVAALANHEGGAILIGVDDEGNPAGLDDIQSTEERVSGVLSSGFTSVVRNVKKAKVNGADILIVNVQRATTAPVDTNGTFHVRTGTTTDRLSGREIIDRFPR